MKGKNLASRNTLIRSQSARSFAHTEHAYLKKARTRMIYDGKKNGCLTMKNR